MEKLCSNCCGFPSTTRVPASCEDNKLRTRRSGHGQWRTGMRQSTWRGTCICFANFLLCGGLGAQWVRGAHTCGIFQRGPDLLRVPPISQRSRNKKGDRPCCNLQTIFHPVRLVLVAPPKLRYSFRQAAAPGRYAAHCDGSLSSRQTRLASVELRSTRAKRRGHHSFRQCRSVLHGARGLRFKPHLLRRTLRRKCWTAHVVCMSCHSRPSRSTMAFNAPCPTATRSIVATN